MDRAQGWRVGREERQRRKLVRRITESFITYRDLVGGYMTYADNGQMTARAGVFGY